jgi:hypothetical protein
LDRRTVQKNHEGFVFGKNAKREWFLFFYPGENLNWRDKGEKDYRHTVAQSHHHHAAGGGTG